MFHLRVPPPHSHNEFLFSAVVFGVFGIIALMLLHFPPIIYFVKFVTNQFAESRATALMDVVLCPISLTVWLTSCFYGMKPLCFTPSYCHC